ncbi:asparaginase domain-containing protein [Nocardioides daphniae]|nr:asparaginase domain-containing protein [Nocardioides daphniae]
MDHRTEAAAAPSSLPRVDLLALGGTIASVPGSRDAGALPTVGADALVAAVPALAEVADVRATQVLQVPSCEVTVPDLVALVATMRAAVDAGATGVVVTQGTDTLEEAAFVVDLLWDRPEPVVFTGALRTPDSPGADGPANLLAAVRVAVAEQARGLGVVAVLNDEVHAARLVRKTHSSNPAAFSSPGAGPFGW